MSVIENNLPTVPERFNSQEEMIKSFRYLYRAYFSESLTDEEALDKGLRLVQFIRCMNPEMDDMIKCSSKYV